jgi:hypothetical protein
MAPARRISGLLSRTRVVYLANTRLAADDRPHRANMCSRLDGDHNYEAV